jgi:SPP1 family predicted phage head-tail adaptor
MRAGELNQHGTIQRYSITRNAVGEETQTWGTYYTGWFQYLPLSGKEFIAAQQVNAEVTGTIRGRWIQGVIAKDRLLMDSGRVFEFLAVMNWSEKNRELRIMAKEMI